MLPVTVGSDTYKVTWQHDRQAESTICLIITNYDGEDTLVASGEALCHHTDNFNYNVGRKLSLARAVVNAFPNSFASKADRRAFWTAYKAMRNGKW